MDGYSKPTIAIRKCVSETESWCRRGMYPRNVEWTRCTVWELSSTSIGPTQSVLSFFIDIMSFSLKCLASRFGVFHRKTFLAALRRTKPFRRLQTVLAWSMQCPADLGFAGNHKSYIRSIRSDEALSMGPDESTSSRCRVRSTSKIEGCPSSILIPHFATRNQIIGSVHRHWCSVHLILITQMVI